MNGNMESGIMNYEYARRAPYTLLIPYSSFLIP